MMRVFVPHQRLLFLGREGYRPERRVMNLVPVLYLAMLLQETRKRTVSTPCQQCVLSCFRAL